MSRCDLAELQLPATSAAARVCLHVCMCRSCHKQPACMCVQVCACVCLRVCTLERAPPSSHRQHRASRSRPVWTRLSSFLQLETPTHALQLGLPLEGAVTSIPGRALIGAASTSPCPPLVQPCGVWRERVRRKKRGGRLREEGCCTLTVNSR